MSLGLNYNPETVKSVEVPDGVKEPTSDPPKVEKAECLCRACNHSLKDCKLFKGKKDKEKIKFLREKGVCFKSLCLRHMRAGAA